jgi:hypothetical protein
MGRCLREGQGKRAMVERLQEAGVCSHPVFHLKFPLVSAVVGPRLGFKYVFDGDDGARCLRMAGQARDGTLCPFPNVRCVPLF